MSLPTGPVTTADGIARHIRLHAGDYFAGVGPHHVDVACRRTSQRINSRLFEFRVSAGPTHYDLMAKVPFRVDKFGQPRADGASLPDRPRLFPEPDWRIKGWHEFLCLSAIRDHFLRSDDPRFGAIRVLDAPGPPHSLIMERGPGTNFGNAWHRTGWRRQDSALQAGFAHAGAWLRRFHGLALFPHTEARQQLRSDFTAAVAAFTSYLANGREGRELSPQITADILQAAHRLLPEHFPLGLIHGDFVPHNILLNPGGRVTVLDTQGRWQAPVYEDLGRFVFAMRRSPIPLIPSAGFRDPGVLDLCEREFLRGYFAAEPIPLAAVRLFECQSLLEWWCTLVHSCQRAQGLPRLAKHCRLVSWRGYLRRHLKRLLERLD
jgi:aminoglycoside phosphotransferase (APT) family kinase protein